MKKEIHPKYFKDAKIICSCGNIIKNVGATKKEIKTELCSSCHPFYTGQQKLVDTAGRVDKFRAKMAKAKTHKSSKPAKDKKNKKKK